MVSGQHPVRKATTLMEEGTNKSAQWAELCAVCPAVMKELNSGKAPRFAFLLSHGQWPNALAIWSDWRAMETWPITGVSVWGMALCKSLRALEWYE